MLKIALLSINIPYAMSLKAGFYLNTNVQLDLTMLTFKPVLTSKNFLYHSLYQCLPQDPERKIDTHIGLGYTSN